MKTLNMLKAGLYGAVVMSLLFHSESLQSAVSNEPEYRLIPLQMDVHMNHAREILGAGETLGASLRSLDFAELLYQKIEDELSPKNRFLAPVIASAVLKASLQYQMDPLFIMAVIKTESRFNPRARGRHGEIGLMQIKPDTAQWMAVRSGLIWYGPESLNDPAINIRLATAYLGYLRSRFDGAGRDYVSAYNMGFANVLRFKKRSVQPAIYANKVVNNYRYMNKALARAAISVPELRVSLAD
jgi:soluble lytic murein transglycosylase